MGGFRLVGQLDALQSFRPAPPQLPSRLRPPSILCDWGGRYWLAEGMLADV